MHHFKIFLKPFLILLIVITTCNNLISSISSNFYLTTADNLIINQDKKTIHTNENFLLIDKLIKYSGKTITIWYKTLNKLTLDEINRIEAHTNIKIENTNNKSIIKADKYIYSAKSCVHTLISENNDLIYQDILRKITAKDRIEYFINKNIIVIRGKPKITGKHNIHSNTYYNFSANLINIQLSNTKKSNKDILFIEAINKVIFKEGDTTITSDYAIYYKEQNQIEFYDNVVFTNNCSSLTGKIAIYNLNLGYGKIISNSNSSPIKGKYNSNMHKNEK